MDIIDGLSMDVEQTEREKLRSVFPECFADGKLDIDKLLNLCGEYIIDDFEKYEFRWKGKGESLQLAQQRSTATLRPCVEESVNWDTTQNTYIEGDNLEVLKLLQTSYYRKVKMIYLDPPYNTGNDFVYEDDFADPLINYKKVTSQGVTSNPETAGRFHTKWLNMMYPRLRLAKNLLRDDGVIFISIDDNEVHNLRKLCDEVFGEENFVGQIIWQRAFAPKNDAKYMSNDHDYILFYAKSINEFTIGRLERTEEANARYKNYDNDPRGVWTSDNLTVKTYSEKYDYPIVTPSGKEVYPSHGSCWRVSKERLQELIADNRIWFGENGDNVPRLKRFLSEVQDGMVSSSLWLFKDVGHNQEGRQELKKLFDDKGYFDGPKPTRLLQRILRIANTSENDIILDFFSGSATTAHAVMQLNKEDGGNRRFIMVQLPELCDEKSEAYKAGYKNICEIGKERIRRAGQKLIMESGKCKINSSESEQTTLDNNSQLSTFNFPFDNGFRVFKLDTSNFRTWDNTPVGDNISLLEERLNNMIERVKPDRTDLDMVFEIMLKLGQNLCESIIPLDFDGKTAYSIRKDCLILICLAPDITTEMVEKMADYAPGRIVFGQKCFADTTAMANARLVLRDIGIECKFV